METYNLRFKKKNERGYWNTSIKGETLEEAIKEAEKFLVSRKGEIKKAYLEKNIYKTKVMCEWESEE